MIEKMIRGVVPCGDRRSEITTEWNPHGAEDIEAGWDVSPGIVDSPGTGTFDYKGVQIGNLVVVGYFGMDNATKSRNGKTRCHQQRHRWLVQCKCGRYELRTQKAIRKALKRQRTFGSKVPCCQKCDLYSAVLTKGAKC